MTDSSTPSASSRSKKPILFVIGLLLVVLTAAFYQNFTGSSGDLADGLKRAPIIELPRASGELVRVKDLKDHVVVVHFWAAWCPPCVPEITEILAAAKKMPKDQKGRPIYWLLVSQDPSWEKAHTVLKEEMLTENVISVLDPEAKVSDSFGSYQFPETYLITRSGGIAAKWIGAQEWSAAWGERALQGIESLSRENKVPGGQ